MKSISLSLLIIISGTIVGAKAEDFRTDINPALRYWEAFTLERNVPSADRDQLRTNEWRGRPLPARFGELVSGYDQEFKLLRAAAHAQVPCDWGLDLTEGPELLLPHLAQAKGVAVTARLRVMWDLQNGRQAEARDDLLASLALARNVSRDGTLISVLVQIAMENILVSTVAENFHQFSPETLKQLEDGFAAAPARGTVARSIATGERSFYDWFLRKAKEAQKKHPGDEAAAMADIHGIFQNALSPPEGSSNTVEKAPEVAAGSVDAFFKLLDAMPPMYDRIAAIMSLPRAEYEAQIGPFMADVRNSSNPMIASLFPVFERCRPKEFAIVSELAMLQAAVEYKINGEAAFNAIMDPAGDGPFVMERFVFKGVDRGFKLKSSYAGRGFPEVMIFVEKDGEPFLVNGKRAGEAVPKE